MLLMRNRRRHCCKCDFLKCYAIVYQNYYCNHEARTDDMGKLTDHNLKEECPVWCPLEQITDNKRN